MRVIIIFSVLLLITACKDSNKQATTALDSAKQEQPTQPSAKKETVEEVKAMDQNTAIVPHHYICYIDDNNPDRKIWISFSEKGKAIQVKYLGQQEGINLVYKKEKYLEGGAHPTITEYYDEIYDGKINGQYELTHSGAWDYVLYIRGKDSKKFNFTIDTNIEDQYSSEPCF